MCTSICSACLARTPSLRCDTRAAMRNLELKFLPVAHHCRRQLLQQSNSIREMFTRFCIRRCADRLLSSPLPVGYGCISQTSLRVMVRHDLRLNICRLWKLLYERAANEAMQLLPTASHQTCIGGILHKSVLELIRGIGWHPTLEDQLRVNELREGRIEFLLRERSDSGD